MNSRQLHLIDCTGLDTVQAPCTCASYRAVASYVTTVNQLYISLLILGYLGYLPRLCGKRVVGCTMNSEMRAAWNLSFYYRYSAVIALGKSNEYCAEIVS